MIYLQRTLFRPCVLSPDPDGLGDDETSCATNTFFSFAFASIVHKPTPSTETTSLDYHTCQTVYVFFNHTLNFAGQKASETNGSLIRGGAQGL